MKKLIIILLFIPLFCQAQIPKDKQLHLGAGFVIGAWGTFAGNSMEYTPEKSALFGIGWVTLAGGLKEGADALGYGTPEWKDFGATMAGGIVGVGLSYAALKIFKKKPPQIFSIAEKDYICVGVKINFSFYERI